MESGSIKIAFCTTIKNRIHHIKETLPRNISDNADYRNLEFVILDYNSDDGLNHWLKQEFSEYIDNGRISYYQINTVEKFHHSHANNLVFRLADAYIVCNINADHYTGKDFAKYVNDSFKADENIVLTPIDFFKTKKNYRPASDSLGRVCVRKKDFLDVNGYDERMLGYAWEDYDFINRVEMRGTKRILIENFNFLTFIGHGNAERYPEAQVLNNIEGLFVNYINPSTSNFLLLYKNQKFEVGKIIDNWGTNSHTYKNVHFQKDYLFRFRCDDEDWKKGTYSIDGRIFKFSPFLGEGFELSKKNSYLSGNDNVQKFYPVISEVVLKNFIFFLHEVSNRNIMENNLLNKTLKVNENKFGVGVLSKNFNYECQISLH